MKNILKLFLIFIFIIILPACSKGEPKKIIYSSENETKKADNLEIVDFHSTHQCYSCLYIGNKALEVLENNFAEEMQSGKISFQKINVDEAQNKEIVNKYKARGSSLFFNSIIDNQDNISEDINIWRLVGKDKEFENYLVNKINNLIK